MTGLRSPRHARALHLVTAVAAACAVLLQLVLVARGAAVLDETEDPGLATRLIRFASYLTIWSNVLVAWTAAALARDPGRDGRAWRALRISAVVVIFGVMVVHFFLLRPLLDLEGWNQAADTLLHVVVPALAVVGWLAFEPRGRVTWPLLGPFLALLGLWLTHTLVRGAVVDWYPYPFLDVLEIGYGRTLLNVGLVCAVMVGLFALARLVDRRLDRSSERESLARAD
ncbi:Pr6Pr family membrane protein [Nocardioides donggukensis]|uniref:Pr6Pr family membrane protein n=1 Tax=Nocardioides donggukensis TaxID=2774019 RepID=A0A927KBE6_9ACTN|nr:Pr6Pr family membrane protein [Nocardioides donggukensis]MBD8871090.1 Pr6Pr family membrane protein [Nocardioides donggukensis]